MGGLAGLLSDIAGFVGKAATKGGKTISIPADIAAALTKKNAPLIGSHNLSSKGVEVARDIGGIPMPSMAISRADYPMTNFGDITLLARPDMVSPSRSVGVWPTDVYTGRQPRGDFEFASDSAASKAMRNDPTFGHMRDAGYWTDATNSFNDADEMMRTAQLGVSEGIDPSGYSSMFDYVSDVRRKLGYNAAGTDDFAGLRDYGDVSHVLYPMDRFTPSGSRRKPSPYTLDAVMSRMNKAKAYTAGSEGWNYGPASFRAIATKPFTSAEQISDARGLIFPSDQISDIKNAYSSAYDSILDEVSAVNPNARFNDASDAMREIALGRNPSWYGNVPASTVANVKSLVAASKNLPTEYFEAKPRIAYRLSDFPAAIVPEGDVKSVENLRRAGVQDVSTYGSPEERAALFKRNRDLLFSAAGTGLLGTALQDRNTERGF